jgi:predicted PurR-regulated permease PerM
MPDPSPSSPPATRWSLPARYLVAVLLILLAAVTVLLLLPLLQVLLLAFLISFLIFIPARALKRRARLPYSLIIAVFFLLLFGLLACALLTVIPGLIAAFNGLWTSVQSGYDQLAAQLSSAQPANNVVTIAGIPVDLSAIRPALQQFIAGQPAGGGAGLSLPDIIAVLGRAAGGLLGLAGSIFNSAAGLVALFSAALVIAFFLLIDLPVSGGILTDWVPPQYSREITRLFARLDQIWLHFFKAELVIGLIIGAGSFVIFLLLGVPFALPLAIIMGTIGLIPTIGGILAMIPLLIDCLLLGSTTLTGLDHVTFALLALVASLVYSQIVYTFVSPKISGAAVQLPAVAVVVGVLAALALAGVLGALLVVPIMGSIRLFVNFALFKLSLRDPYPDDATAPADIPGFFSQMLYVKPPAKRGQPPVGSRQ